MLINLKIKHSSQLYDKRVEGNNFSGIFPLGFNYKIVYVVHL